MYSIVIAAVLTTGTPAPAFGHHRSSYGDSCIGCSGSCMGCSGCSGCSGCNGCCGGSGFLGIRDWFSNMFSGGCNGGCCGGGCMGCSGCCGGGCCGGGGMSCMGCSGMSCMGCSGGFPMSSSGMPMNTSFSYDMPMGYPMMGQMGQMPTDGMMMQAPMATNPMMPNTLPNPLPQGPMPQPYQSATPANQTTVVVTLPADARLYVDGQQLTLNGAVRQFRTPDLQPGTKYAYTIKIEVERNGKTVDQTQTVSLEPGKTAQVHFAEPGSPGSPNA